VTHRGFTLLEMVVAIAIFGVIAAMSYAALNNFLEARVHINAENEKLQALQNTFVILERDLRFATPRPVRDNFGDAEPAFIGTTGDALAGGERLRLTTLRPAPAESGLQQAARVAWRLDDDELSRVTWPVLDRDLDTRETRRRMISDVAELSFRFFSYQGDDSLTASSEWISDTALPAGVEITVLMDDQPAYQRIVQVGGGGGGAP